MAIKPSPTIAGKLRKLFSNNKQTIEPAINESIPGGSGGANVLTLYANFSEVFGDGLDFTVYKNAVLTERYASKEEAINAINGAGAIVIVLVESTEENMRLYPINSIFGFDYVMANVIIDAPDGLAQKPGYLYGAGDVIH